MISRWFPWVIALATIGRLGAASDETPKPTAPYLAHLPAEASWKMDFSPANSPAADPNGSAAHPAPPTRKQVVCTKSGGVRHEVITWSNGTIGELWILEHTAFYKYPPSAQYGVFLPQDDASPEGHEGDFRELTWVDRQHFVRVEVKNGQKCFVYAIENRDPPYPSSPDDAKLGPATVWVNVATRLPVAWQDEQTTANFTFNLAVGEMTLPKECQDILDSIHAYAKRAAGQRMVLPP